MSSWELPTTLTLGEKEYEIRTDFRAILDILQCFSDPEYEPDEKWAVCLDILYVDCQSIPPAFVNEAAKKALWFIDMGKGDDGSPKPHVMDWEQDAPIILPAINKVMGKEVRSMQYLHWWTFLGAYMEVGESLFSQVLSIRQKKSKGKRMEKWEREFYRNNKELCDLKVKYTEKEKAEQERLNALLK